MKTLFTTAFLAALLAVAPTPTIAGERGYCPPGTCGLSGNPSHKVRDVSLCRAWKCHGSTLPKPPRFTTQFGARGQQRGF